MSGEVSVVIPADLLDIRGRPKPALESFRRASGSSGVPVSQR